MKTSIFRLLLVLSILTAAGAFIAAVLAHRMLPPELWAYQASRPPIPASGYGRVVFRLSCGFGLAAIVSYFGLFRWKAWARTLFLLAVLASGLLPFFSTDPVIYTAPMYAFITANLLLCGMLAAVMYFNPEIKNRFAGIISGPPPVPAISENRLAGKNLKSRTFSALF